MKSLLSFFLLLTCSLSLASSDAIKPSFRHMIILQADMESIWGSYYFAVNNQSSSEVTAKIPLLIPKETIHFEAGENLTAANIQVDEAGLVYAEKAFPVGLHLMSLRFQTKHKNASAYNLNFKAVIDMEEFSVIQDKKTLLQLSAKDFVNEIPAMVQNGSFDGIMSKETIKKDQEFMIHIGGLPENRDLFWLLGWIFFAALILISGLFATKAQMKIKA